MYVYYDTCSEAHSFGVCFNTKTQSFDDNPSDCVLVDKVRYEKCCTYVSHCTRVSVSKFGRVIFQY